MAARMVSFADKLRIFQHELLRCLIVISDLLERREGQEADWDRLTLAMRRLRAVQEIP
jgi:hypothetical protein